MSGDFPRPPEWMKKAVCIEVGGDMWFPEDGEHGTPMKTLCKTCPVRSECLDYALKNDEAWGIWGGLSTWERKQLPAHDRRAA